VVAGIAVNVDHKMNLKDGDLMLETTTWTRHGDDDTDTVDDPE